MLDTIYKDDKFSGKRKYRIVQNDDGTVSFDDVTNYVEVGTEFGAADLNEINDILKKVKSAYGYKMFSMGDNYNLVSSSSTDAKVVPFKKDISNSSYGDFIKINSNGVITAKESGHFLLTVDLITFATETSLSNGLVYLELYKNNQLYDITKFFKPIQFGSGYNYESHSFTFAINLVANDTIKFVMRAESSANMLNTNFHKNSTVSIQFHKK